MNDTTIKPEKSMIPTISIACLIILRLIYTQICCVLDYLFCSNTGSLVASKIFRWSFDYFCPQVNCKIINEKYFNRDNTIYIGAHVGYYDGILLEKHLQPISLIAKDFGLANDPIWDNIFNIKNFYYLLGGNGRFEKNENANEVFVLKTKETDPINGEDKTEGGYFSMLEAVVENNPKNLFVFPSGTFKRKFRTGIFRLAKTLGYSICPVILKGFPKHKDNPFMFNCNEIQIKFLKPLKIPSDMNIERVAKFFEKICHNDI